MQGGQAHRDSVDEDRVELSPLAAGDEPQANQMPEERIHLLRAQIAADTYVTPEKLDVVVARLLDDLTGVR